MAGKEVFSIEPTVPCTNRKEAINSFYGKETIYFVCVKGIGLGNALCKLGEESEATCPVASANYINPKPNIDNPIYTDTGALG